jgi:hypothetical protein
MEGPPLASCPLVAKSLNRNLICFIFVALSYNHTLKIPSFCFYLDCRVVIVWKMSRRLEFPLPGRIIVRRYDEKKVDVLGI